MRRERYSLQRLQIRYCNCFLASSRLPLRSNATELLKEVVPGDSRIAVLSNPTNAVVPRQMRETKVAAWALGIQLLPNKIIQSQRANRTTL